MHKKIKKILEALFGDSISRYEARHDILCHIVKRFGFRMYNRNLIWHNDSEFKKVWRGFIYGNEVVKDRNFHLYYLAKSIKNLPADTAECGAYKGASSYLILRAVKSTGDVPERVHHVFDSFDGLSAPRARDLNSEQHVFKWKHGDLCASESCVRESLSMFKNVKYYKGWIPSRFTEVRERRFSFVHIDVDLYQPSFDSLVFFYERMVPSGIILCDDYGYSSCPGAYEAMNEFFSDKSESIIPLTTGQAFVVKH